MNQWNHSRTIIMLIGIVHSVYHACMPCTSTESDAAISSHCRMKPAVSDESLMITAEA